MKKIDKLVLDAFLGPFVITFLVVVFILLNIQMLKYFDDIIGKGLEWIVLGQLLFYFAIYTIPTAMPLAVLLSSLIAYGNLGEHFELTAIKGSGISLLRTLQPIFFFVLFLTLGAFYVNNTLVPKAALEAYSLLYDIKQKKPALDLREGTFYNGLPDISIKVDQKYPDGESLKNVIIYNHQKNDGNRDVTVADSGRMYTILNERYLKFELYNGYNYTEGGTISNQATRSNTSGQEVFSRTKFGKHQVVYDLSSFDMTRTDKRWFESNRIMRNISQLESDIDSIHRQIMEQRITYYLNKPSQFNYVYRKDAVTMPEDVAQYQKERDSINRAKYEERRRKESAEAISKRTIDPSASKAESLKRPGNKKSKTTKAKPALKLPDKKNNKTLPAPVNMSKLKKQAEKNDFEKTLQQNDSLIADSLASYYAQVKVKADSLYAAKPGLETVRGAADAARQFINMFKNGAAGIETYTKERIVFEIQWHKILANSLACIAMFLIGAPLGAIIKRGGLGVPFLVSILFFIIFYLLTMQGEKLAKQETISVEVGIWAANVILFIIGLFFLRQARNDARLFEADFYSVLIDKVKRALKAGKTVKMETAS